MTEAAPAAPRSSRLLAGDRLIVAVWLTLLVVAARVGLQSSVDFSGREQLRGTDLWEHAIEHTILTASSSWILVAVLTLLPCGLGPVFAALRALGAATATVLLVSGLLPREGEVQYLPSLVSLRGILGWLAVLAMAAVVVLLDRWATRPRRPWWRRTAATRFCATALVLLVGGAGFVGVQKRIEHVRRFIYVQGPAAEFLEEFRRGAHREVEGEVSIASVSPGRSFESSGGNKPSLLMAPGSFAEFEAVVPPYSWLSFSYAASLDSIREIERQNDSWDPSLRFEVRVDGATVFEEYLQPVGDLDERKWFDGRVELDRWEGRSVRIRFAVEAEGDGARSVRAGFGRPLLMRSTSVRRSPSGPEAPNVVLVVVDSLRADHLGCYGYEVRDTTPLLDEVAEGALLYENAQAASSWSWPAVATLLTGMAPPAHGVVAEDRCFLSDRLDTLPELLQRVGVSTAGWTNSPLISQRKNFAQGFELWGEAPAMSAAYVVGEFQGFVKRRQSAQFFAYLHLADPSAPYRAPPRFRGRFTEDPDYRVNDGLDEAAVGLAGGDPSAAPDPERLDQLQRLYDEELLAVDHHLSRIRRILDESGVRDRTVVIVVGSHGEEFLDHGGLQHGWTLYDEVVNVPLIIEDPRREAARIAEPVDLSGLCDTVLRMVGADLAIRQRTPALPPYLELGERNPRAFAHTLRGVYSGESARSRWAVRDARFKLMVETDESSPLPVREVLYDLVRDPGETVDVAAEHPEVVGELERAWRKWLERCQKIGVELPPEERLERRFLPHLPGAPRQGRGSEGEVVQDG